MSRDVLNGVSPTGTFLDQFSDGYLRGQWDEFVARRDNAMAEFVDMSGEVYRIERELERRKQERGSVRTSEGESHA